MKFLNLATQLKFDSVNIVDRVVLSWLIQFLELLRNQLFFYIESLHKKYEKYFETAKWLFIHKSPCILKKFHFSK